MLWVHIGAGVIALLAGFTALFARKGRGVHVASGRMFASAMAALTVSAVLIAAYTSPNPGNVQIGLMTLYMVATAWLAMRPEPWRRGHIALAAVGFGSGAYGLFISKVGFQSAGGIIGGIPAGMTLTFAVVTLLAVAGDLRMLWRGRPEGAGRLLRHLWRMGFALWIATLSFFLGQADELPAQLRQSGVLMLPVLAVTGTLLFWVVSQSRRVVAGRRGTGRGPLGPRQ